MDNQSAFKLLLDGMLDNAVEEFQSTGQYRLLKEKLEQMEQECETNLTKSELTFTMECFNLLLDVSGQQECYVYRQGIHDGIFILKALGVLA